jgi:hypothetical protein
MSIQNDDLYFFYLAYLNSQRFSKPQIKLLSISKDSFDKFCIKWKNEPLFKAKWEDIFKSWVRDKKLKKFLQEDDTEDFEFNSTATFG